MKFIERFEDGIEINDVVGYISSFEIHNTPVNLYEDDYGQCYFFTFKKENNEIEEIGCGTYCYDFFETICSIIDKKGGYISLEGEQAWNELIEYRAEKGLENIDYDDYEIYDFDQMYKELEEELNK